MILSKDIKSIRFAFKYLENIKLESKEKLTTQIIIGKISLYNYVELQKGETEDVPNSNGGKFTLNKLIQHYIAKNGQGYQKLVKTNFPEDLKQLINDCPALILKINNQEYTFEDMPEIIKQYNSCKN